MLLIVCFYLWFTGQAYLLFRLCASLYLLSEICPSHILFHFILDRPRLHLLIILSLYLQEMSPDIRRKVDAVRAVRLARETGMKNKMTAQVCNFTIFFSNYSSGSNLVCSVLRLNFAIIATLFHVLIPASVVSGPMRSCHLPLWFAIGPLAGKEILPLHHKIT